MGSHSCISRRTHLGVLGIDAGPRARGPRWSGPACVSPLSRSVPLRSRKPLSSRLPITSSANCCSFSVKSLICSCQRRWSTSELALREVLLDGGSSSKPPRLVGRGCCSVRFSRNCSQSISWTRLSSARFSRSRRLRLLGRHRRGVGRLCGSIGISPVLASAVAAGPGVDLLVGQHRVGVELLADLVDELQARELQEADRLLQLRRHHELLTEPELLLDLHRAAGRFEEVTPRGRRSQHQSGDFRASASTFRS